MDPFEHQPQQQELLAPNPASPLPGAEIEELRQQCLDLRTLFNAALCGLILLSIAANLVFGKQMLVVRRQIEEQKPNFTRAETDFRRNREPEMRRFVDDLLRYSATHPDFRSTVLDRYRVALAQYFSASGGGSSANPEAAPIPQPANSPLARPPGR